MTLKLQISMKTFKTTFIREDSALPGKLFWAMEVYILAHISSIMCLPPYILYWGFLLCSVVENPPANADSGDMGLIPGSGRFPGGGHGNPLQYSSLENPVGRGAWLAAVHRITERQT